MIKILFVSIACLLAGCATTTAKDVSPTQSYRPMGADELWSITGHIDSEFKQGFIEDKLTRILHVYINGEMVLNGGLSPMGTGELTGRYKDHEVISSCSSERKTPNWIDVRCMILIDNERAATLTF